MPVQTEARYSLELLKVTGMIPETLQLLQRWSPGMSAQELAQAAIPEGLLGKASASRVKDLVYQGFAKRYLRPGEHVARTLKNLVERGIPLTALRQLLLLYTCRQQALLRDFLLDVYWPKSREGRSVVTADDIRGFILSAFGTERAPRRWSEAIVAKLTRSIPKCLTDFGLLGPYRPAGRDILAFRIEAFTILYLAYEAHFSGVSDTAILFLSDWACFGLAGHEVVAEFRRAAATHDDFILQYSGELARLSWKHKTMEEFLHAHAG